MTLAVSYPRPDSPVPPPMPSPTLKPMPLPSPPAHSRQARPSRERSSLTARKPFPVDVPDSPVFALKDALVCKPRGRSMDRRDLDVEELDLNRRPVLRFRTSHESEGNLSITSTPPPPRLKHRRSDSISFTGVSPTRARSRSPGPRWSQEDAPPVPPLPSSSKSRVPPIPIRIPELGLGIEESLRSPVSNSSHASHSSSFTNSTTSTSTSSSSSHQSISESSAHGHATLLRRSNEDSLSFLQLTTERKLRKKHRPTLSGPVPGCLSMKMRTSHSLPNIKGAAGKGRSNGNGGGVSFAGRFLRIGVH